MWALVTGASSGIGRDMARYLYSLGYSIIIVARNENKLEELKQELEKNNSKNINNKENTNFVMKKANGKLENNDEVTEQQIIVISEDLS